MRAFSRSLQLHIQTYITTLALSRKSKFQVESVILIDARNLKKVIELGRCSADQVSLKPRQLEREASVVMFLSQNTISRPKRRPFSNRSQVRACSIPLVPYSRELQIGHAQPVIEPL